MSQESRERETYVPPGREKARMNRSRRQREDDLFETRKVPTAQEDMRWATELLAMTESDLAALESKRGTRGA